MKRAYGGDAMLPYAKNPIIQKSTSERERERRSGEAKARTTEKLPQKRKE